jgi:hypothetical protein
LKLFFLYVIFMELTDYIIIILLLSCLILWILNFLKKCPQPYNTTQIVYRYRPELDLQYDENNMPSKIYDSMFNGPNVFQGGYSDTYSYRKR